MNYLKSCKCWQVMPFLWSLWSNWICSRIKRRPCVLNVLFVLRPLPCDRHRRMHVQLASQPCKKTDNRVQVVLNNISPDISSSLPIKSGRWSFKNNYLQRCDRPSRPFHWTEMVWIPKQLCVEVNVLLHTSDVKLVIYYHLNCPHSALGNKVIGVIDALYLVSNLVA